MAKKPWMYYRIWWLGHSSELNFILQKLFRISWWSNFILRISLKFFAGICNPSRNLNFFLCHFVVCFDGLVVVASSSSVEAQLITNIHKIFSRILKTYISFQQKFSEKWLKQMLFTIEKGRTFVTNVFTRIFMWDIIL